MKTKPKLNDLQNVEINTLTAGDAIVFNGTTWGNTPITPDRIVDGTTILSVDTDGVAELSIDDHTVLTTDVTQATFFAPVGDVGWCQWRESRTHDIVIRVGDNAVAVSEQDNQEYYYGTGYVVGWDLVTGEATFSGTMAEIFDESSEVNLYVAGVSSNTTDSALVSLVCPVDQDEAIGVIQISPLLRTVEMCATIVANGSDRFPLQGQRRVEAMWINSTNIIITYPANSGQKEDDPPWTYSLTTIVISLNAQNNTVNWVRRVPIGPVCMYIDESTYTTSIFGYTPAYNDDLETFEWFPTISRVSSSGVILPTVKIQESSNYYLDMVDMHVIGDVAYIIGEYYDNATTIVDAASICAVNCNTGAVLWHRIYLNGGVGITQAGIGVSICQHPTVPTQLVAVFNVIPTTNDPINVIAGINIADGTVESAFSIGIIDPENGPVFPNSNDMDFQLTTGDSQIILTHNYSESIVGSIVACMPYLSARTLGPLTLTALPGMEGTIPGTPVTALLSSGLTSMAVTATPYTSNTSEYDYRESSPYPTDPYTTVAPKYIVRVEGDVSISSNIELANTFGTVGDVITQTATGARWAPPEGGGGDSLWIINPTKRNIANTHPNWVGTSNAPLDPLNPNHFSSFYDNIAVGAGALEGGNWTSGGEGTYEYNVGIGTNTLKALRRGRGNIAIGTDTSSGIHYDNVDYTVNLGHRAGYQMRGSGAIAIGAYAQQTSSPDGGDRSNSIGIGYSAGSTNGVPQSGIAIGPNACYSFPDPTISSCVAIGESALYSGTEGTGTVAVGGFSQEQVPAGTFNTSIGYQTLRQRADYYPNNNTATHCTAMGMFAMTVFAPTQYDNVSYNTAMGFASLHNAGGQYNTAVGAEALKGETSLSGFSKGSYNTALGARALYDTSGITNPGQYINCTGVGFETLVTGSNQVQLGNLDTTTYAFGAVQNRSDARDKTDVRDTALGLDFINQLRPVDFKWDYRESYTATTTNDDGTTTTTRIPSDGSKKRNRYHHGLIAQEVKQVLESTGVDFGGYQDHAVGGGQDVLTIGYGELIAPMIKAIQQLTVKLSIQAEIIDELQQTVAGMNAPK